MARRLWTRNEQVRALELYLRTPFGKIHSRNPAILSLASKLNRSANALALKMSNFAALDPTIPQKGMSNFSKADAEIWSEFFDAPSSFLTEVARIDSAPSFDGQYPTQEHARTPLEYEAREGQDVRRLANVRVNQDYFRKMLLASYDSKCAITGIAQSDLLIASHIKPWSQDVESRLDPRNGILLNSLHDRAFDSGLITFDRDLNLVVSKQLDLPEIARPFFIERRLTKPSRFAPDPVYLDYHRTHKFRDSPKFRDT